jgi:hypothetical protein
LSATSNLTLNEPDVFAPLQFHANIVTPHKQSSYNYSHDVLQQRCDNVGISTFQMKSTRSSASYGINNLDAIDTGAVVMHGRRDVYDFL